MDSLLVLWNQGCPWSLIVRIVSSDFAKSVNVFAVSVPLFASLLLLVEDGLSIVMIGWDLSLTFSSVVVYLGAYGILVARFVTQAFCPPMILNSRGFEDYLNHYVSSMQALEKLPKVRERDENISCLEELGEEGADVKELFKSLIEEKANAMAEYKSLRDEWTKHDNVAPRWRRFISVLLALSLLFLGFYFLVCLPWLVYRAS